MISREKVYEKLFENIFSLFSDEIKNKAEIASIFMKFLKYKDEKVNVPLKVFDILESCKKLGFDDYPTSGIQLLMYSSIIEELTRRVEYVDFPIWYKKNSQKYEGKEFITAFHDWRKIHGNRKNYRNFFVNVLNNEEKIQLLTKFKRRHDELSFVPFCFKSKEECYERDSVSYLREGKMVIDYGEYSPSCKGSYLNKDCPAMNDKKVLTKGIRKYANVLYDLRNNFAHKAEIPTLSHLPPLELYDFISGDVIIGAKMTTVHTIIRTDNYKGWCSIDLHPKDLYDLVIKYLPFMFEKYLGEVETQAKN